MDELEVGAPRDESYVNLLKHNAWSALFNLANPNMDDAQ